MDKAKFQRIGTKSALALGLGLGMGFLTVVLFIGTLLDAFPLSMGPAKLNLCLLVASAGTLFFCLLSTVFPSSRHAPQYALARRQKKAYFFLSAILCTFIFAKLTIQVQGPLDWDELDISTKLLSSGESIYTDDPTALYIHGDVLNPFSSLRNHFLATASSWLSIKLLGISELNLRLPSLLYSLIFLILLVCWGGQVFHPMTVILVLANFITNQEINWYMTSMRGYILMMLLSLVAYLTVIRATLNPIPKWGKWLFFLAIAGSPFAHTFGAIHGGLLIFGLLLWLYTNPNHGQRNQLRQLLTLAIAAMPLVGITAVFHAKHINEVGFLYSIMPHSLVSVLPQLFGLASEPIFLIALFFLGIGFIQSAFSQSRFSMVNILGFTYLSGLFVLLFITKPDFFFARFLLSFFLPLMAWSMEAWLSHKKLKKALVPLFVLIFVVGPIFEAPKIAHDRSSLTQAFHRFSKQAKNKLALQDCLYFSGEGDQIRFARTVYFSSHRADKQEVTCRGEYLMHFSHAWNAVYPPRLPKPGKYELLFDDNNGRQLFRIGKY